MTNRKIMPKGNDFYRLQFQKFMWAVIGSIVVLLLLVSLVLYQVLHKPLPEFYAVSGDQQLELNAADTPNLVSNTILRWAGKAAVAAYTFDFVNYEKQIAAARSYFTDSGWRDYQNSVASLIKTITQNQLFVNGVVAGPPVISNEGDLTGRGYVWRIQIPFLVTYQSANTSSNESYTVIMTIVRVPTSINPQGIGVDQFLMV